MLTYFDLRKGVRFVLGGEPYEVLDFKQIGKAQDVVVARVKIKNLINGKIMEKNFHQSDLFEEAEIEKINLKFIFAKGGKYHFCELENPSRRYELEERVIGEGADLLKQGMIVTGLKFMDKMINIALPLKVVLRVVEAPPGVKAGRSQPGTKHVVLETGAKINAPLFIEKGDLVEVNTETREYIRRVQENQ